MPVLTSRATRRLLLESRRPGRRRARRSRTGPCGGSGGCRWWRRSRPRRANVEQSADVGRRHEVAVHDEQRRRSAAPAAGRARRPCRAARPRAGSRSRRRTRCRRRSASSMTSAEVVHRDEDALDPEARRGAARSARGSAGRRRAASASGRSSVSGRSRVPWPPAMITRPVRRAATWRRNSWSRWSADRRPSASTTGIAAIRRARMSSSASARRSPGIDGDEPRGSGRGPAGRRGRGRRGARGAGRRP